MKVLFSVNSYDYEGDMIDTGVYLHFGDTSIKVADDAKGFDSFIEDLKAMSGEIHEMWLD